MKKTKILRKIQWEDVNITYVPSTPPSKYSPRKMARLDEFFNKMPKEKRDKILNGDY